MTRPNKTARYYQGLADLHIIAGSLAALGGQLTSTERDRSDLALMARIAAKCIARGPEKYHHVIEESPDIQAIWQQFAA